MNLPESTKIWKVTERSGQGLMSYGFSYYVISCGKPCAGINKSEGKEVSLEYVKENPQLFVDEIYIDKRLSGGWKNWEKTFEILKTHFNPTCQPCIFSGFFQKVTQIPK